MNLLKQAGQALATFAPTIATALGGPLAGVAVNSLEKVFGIDPASSPEGKQAAIEQSLLSATPDQILALKKAENDFQVQMKELGISEEKLVYDDIANARSREVAVKDTTPRNLAYLIIGFTGVCIAATLAGWTKVDSALAGTLIGYLVAECRSTLTYYFGSSQGSRDKDAALAEIAKS